MKKIIVTGGAGYIGSHTVIELVKAGYEPIIVDNFANSDERIIKQIEKIVEREVEVHKIDCKNEQQLSKLFILEGKIDGIIHFAAHKAVGESVKEPLEYYTNNILSLTNILKLMKVYDVPNIVFSSSCTVYGEPEKVIVTEDSPRLDASSPYGNTKRICEDLLMDEIRSESGLNAMILRYFNPIGAHPSSMLGELPSGVPNNLVPYITQTAAGIREELQVFGDDYNTEDGTCVRDYVHIVDLAKAHVKALSKMTTGISKNNLDVFNLGTGKGTSVLELIKTFETINDVKINYKMAPRRPGDITEIYANVDKAKAALQWETELTYEDALRDAWNWQCYLQENW